MEPSSMTQHGVLGQVTCRHAHPAMHPAAPAHGRGAIMRDCARQSAARAPRGVSDLGRTRLRRKTMRCSLSQPAVASCSGQLHVGSSRGMGGTLVPARHANRMGVMAALGGFGRCGGAPAAAESFFHAGLNWQPGGTFTSSAAQAVGYMYITMISHREPPARPLSGRLWIREATPRRRLCARAGWGCRMTAEATCCARPRAAGGAE